MAITPDRAEIVALGALGWLADNDLLDAFMGTTGAERDQLRAAAADPAFLAGVLDLVMGSDAWVEGVCDALGLTFEAFASARAALPGGDLPHWT
jgi:hypothetical protein